MLCVIQKQAKMHFPLYLLGIAKLGVKSKHNLFDFYEKLSTGYLQI